MKFLPIESVRESDSYTIKNNISEEELIRNVGEALSKAYLFGGKTLVIAGSGNNGADGIALSLALTKRKHEVEILLSEGKLNSISEKLLSEFNVRVYKDPSIMEKRAYCDSQMKTLYPEIKRIENPHTYFVDGTESYVDFKNQMIKDTKKLVKR